MSAPLFDLRAGERRPALGAFLLLTLLIGGHTLLETARDALFLSKLPAAQLALVYALIAGLALVLSALNYRFVRRFGEGRALLITLAAAAGGTTALYLVPPTPAVVFGIYVWSALLATVMVVQFWMFLAQVFTPSQARRLFGPIAAGGVVGALLGAGGAMAALTLVPVRALLLGAAATFVLGALLSTAIDGGVEGLAASARVRDSTRSEPPGLERTSSESWPPPAPDAAPRGLALLREHPYVGWLAALTALSTAAVLGTDYLFKAEAANHVAPEQLGAYFARSYAAFNGLALVVQVFVSAPLVRRVGVARAILVMPLLLLAGIATVIVTDAPTAVLLTRGVDGSLRHSLHRVTSELLSQPIPADVRARVKPALEGVLPRAVQATMAAVILLLAATGYASPRVLAAVVAGLTVAWIATAIGVRRPHLDLFRRAIAKDPLHAGTPLPLDAAVVQAVVETLSSPDPARVIAAMDLLAENMRARAIPGHVLHHEAEEVQIHALRLMAKSGRREWAPRAERLLVAGSSERVRVAAVRALATSRVLGPLAGGLRDESPAVRAHAAVALTCATPGGDAASAPAIRELLALPGEAGREARLALLDAIRDDGDLRFSGVILGMIEHDEPEIMERAVLAMASVRDPRFIPILLRHLHVRSCRAAVREALADLGAPAQDALERAMRGATTAPATRLHIPRTLCRFGNQRAADFLTEQLAIDPSRLVRYKVLRGLGRLVADSDVRVDRKAILGQMRRNLVEHLETLAAWVPFDGAPQTRETKAGELLLGLLADKLRQSLERAFRLLHVAHRREDIQRVHLLLGSSDRHDRSNAMEFLDALTSTESDDEASETRELLRLVVDDLPAAEKVQRAAAYVPDPPASVAAALLSLVGDHDTALAALAAYHAQELGLHDVLAEVERAARQRPSLFEMTRAAFTRPARAEEALHVGP